LQKDRINYHEIEAARETRHENVLKIAAIREIWANGGEVSKTKVAFFENELDAYIYEWGLMNASTYAESLTNINTTGDFPFTHMRRVTIPELLPFEHRSVKHWGCFKSPKGVIYHQVIDIHSFARRHKVSIVLLIDLAKGKKVTHRHSWILAEECCGRNYIGEDPESSPLFAGRYSL